MKLPKTLLALLLTGTATCASSATLNVTIDQIRVQSGELRLALYDSEDAWKGTAKAVAGRGGAPDGSTALNFSFEDLAPGRYALRVMHDENSNGKLDRNLLGMPKEGYGASNNPKVMRAPRFDESSFEIGETDLTIVVSLN
jgi:uncharacterized protein (DUF2141 family)